MKVGVKALPGLELTAVILDVKPDAERPEVEEIMLDVVVVDGEICKVEDVVSFLIVEEVVKVEFDTIISV